MLESSLSFEMNREPARLVWRPRCRPSRTLERRIGMRISGGMAMSGWIRGAVSACLLAMLFAVLAPSAPHALATPPAQSDTGEFRMIVGEPSSLDPNIAVDYSIFVTSQLFDPLYRMEEDGSLTMLGAESYEVSEDGLTWTFKLNPNARWSDGEPITASDWVYSWLRTLDP